MADDEDREGQWVSRLIFDHGYEALEKLGIKFPALLEAVKQEVAVVARQRETEGRGLSGKPVRTNSETEAVKQELLYEIRYQAPLLPPRGRNWVCGYLRSNFSELAGCFTAPIDPRDDAAWKAKIEEIISTSLAEPTWPILLGRFCAAVAQMAEATKNDAR